MLIVSIIALVLWKLSGMPFWAAFAIALVGILINGAVAEVEDNQPGGFNNPTNKEQQ